MKNNVMLYTAYAEKFRSLSDEQFGKLVRAMLEYQASGESPEISDAAVSLSFDVVRVDIDSNNEKYERVVERNRENGKKGGRPKNPVGYLETEENPKNPEEPKKADKDKDKDKVTFKKSNKTNRSYSDDEQLNKAILDFIDHRKKLKKPMTDRAIQLFIQKLNGLDDTISGQIELINTAIERGWQSVYPSDKKKIAVIEDRGSSKLKALEDLYLNEEA